MRYCFLSLWLIYSVIILVSCAQGNSHLLIKINDRDSVTVGEYRLALREAGLTNSSFEERRRVAMNLLNERLKGISAEDHGLLQQDEIRKILQQYEVEILRNEARERDILPRYLNDSTVAFFQRHIGKIVESKNFVYRYKDNPRSKITRNRDEAKRFVDSLYQVLNRANYDTLTYQFSEYIDRSTGRGNYHPDQLPFGALPYEYEMVVFKASDDTILPPIEIQGAFLIPWIIRFTQDTAQKPVSFDEAQGRLRKKLEMMDAGLLHTGYIQLTDSLMRAGVARLIEPALDTFLAVVPLNKTADTVLMEMPDPYRRMALVDFSGKPSLTFEELIRTFPLQYPLPRFTRDNLKEHLIEKTRDRLFIQRILDADFKNTDRFRYAFNKKKNALLIQRIQPLKISRPDTLPIADLRRFYETHINEFVAPGSVQLREINSVTEEPLHKVRELFQKGYTLEKAVDSVKQMDWTTYSGKKTRIVLKPVVTIVQGQEAPFAEDAFHYEAGELSAVRQQKNKTFSMLYIVHKKEPQRQSFEVARKKVETRAIEEEVQQQERRWLNEMKKKFRIILYENRL